MVPALHHEPRDPFNVASPKEPSKRLPTDNPHPEGVGTLAATGYRYGDATSDFQEQIFPEMSSMTYGLNGHRMEDFDDMQPDFDTELDSAVRPTEYQMADLLGGIEISVLAAAAGLF